MKALLLMSLVMVLAFALGAVQGHIRGKRFAESLKKHIESQKDIS